VRVEDAASRTRELLTTENQMIRRRHDENDENPVCDGAGNSDFVFEDDYALMPLEEVERYIDEHGHLPEIPSAAEIQANGAKLGEMQGKLLQKIEELTLYLMEQQQTLADLQEENALLSERLATLEGADN